MTTDFHGDEIKNQSKTVNLPLTINPAIQDKLDSLPVENSYQNEYETLHDVGPYQVDLQKPAPDFVSTMVHAMPFMSHFADAPDLNPLSDTTPQGWNAASDDSNFIGINQKNIGYIAKATSPNDAFFRRQDALRKQQEDQDFEDGSMLAKLTGGFIDSLPFSMIPLGQAMKFATLSETILNATFKSFPSIAGGSLLYEASNESRKIGGNIEDALLNTYVDTIAGLAFIGAGAGIAKGFDGLKFFNAREMMKFNFKGIDPMMVLDEKGHVEGYMAVPAPGLNVSAAEVDYAQAFLNSSFAENGLFAIPKVGGLMRKGVSLVNPIVRGLSSRFETVRGFTDRAANHGFVTKGIEASEAKPEDFESLMGIVMAENKIYYGQIQTLLDERNEINNSSSIINLAERTRKKWKDEGYVDAEKFGDEVKQVIISGTQHENGTVNKAADLTREYLDSTWNLFREYYQLPENWMPPPTADGYFPRVYNIGLMTERPEQWRNMWVGWWKQADQEINTAMKPINDFADQVKIMKSEHENLLNTKGVTDEQIKTSKNELKAARRRLRKMKEDLADRIKTDKRMFLHGDDHAALSGKESRELKKLQKPLRKAKRDLTKEKANRDKLKQEKFFIENKIEQAGSKEKAKKLLADKKALESELKLAEQKVSEVQDIHDTEVEKLQEMASEGKINRRLYDEIPGSQRVAFKKASNLMKFRKTFESEFHMQQQADALRDTIRNQTPEDTLNQVLGHYIGSTSENPTLKRSQMIPDEILQTNQFLSNNLPLIIANYRNALHRKINMKRVYNDVSVDGGIEPVIERLRREMKTHEQAILDNKKFSDKERAKELKKLESDFNDAKEFMQMTHNRMMGRMRGGKKMNHFIKLMRLWTVSTRLGSVPLTMTTDLSAIIYKHGFWPSIRDGLIPALENMAYRIKHGEGGAYTDNAAHAHLGLETVLNAYNDRNWSGIAMEHVPMTGTLGNFMEHAAHISNNISMTNQATNALQRIAASTIQSKIIRYLIQHQEGTLAKKDLQKLLMYGLDPEKWSERFLKGYEKHGYEGSVKGSHQSNYWKWDDAEAANKMSEVIYKGVQDTIIKKGMMTAPFFYDDPIWGTLFFFHGWSTAALTRYLVPLMQTPDAEHLTGLAWMMAMGSLVSPLRRISKGESPIDDETKMFTDMLTDSGILTPIMSLVENANILANGAILNGISNDRYRQRSIAGALGGPVLGLGDDVTRIIGMLLSGRLNETDVKKAARLIPMMQPWYLKGLQNKMIESLGLPKTIGEYSHQSANAYR